MDVLSKEDRRLVVPDPSIYGAFTAIAFERPQSFRFYQETCSVLESVLGVELARFIYSELFDPMRFPGIDEPQRLLFLSKIGVRMTDGICLNSEKRKLFPRL
jgi:hypothetical protein